MKKILLTLALISILSCSKNEEKAINPLKEKLVGSWRYVGDVTYDLDLPGGELLNPHNGNSISTFHNNNSFFIDDNNSLIANGSYNLTMEDSILHRVFYDNGQIIYKDSIKISKLNNSTLELSPPTFDPFIDTNNLISRYEKVITP